MSMKTICCLNDLREYGINLLTGEADALSYRILCDLTPRGRSIFCQAYSVLPGGLSEAWNSGGVASVMLAHGAWEQLGPIALLDAGCHTVLLTDKGLFGFEADEEFTRAEYDLDAATDRYVETKPAQYARRLGSDTETTEMPWPDNCYGKPQRTFGMGNGPRRGYSNVHAFSGRAA
jgi:hypothetical protein